MDDNPMGFGPDLDWVPCTYESYDHIEGPFYHGTASVLQPGDLLEPGHESNYQRGRTSNNIYFSGSAAAGLAAEMATALLGIDGRGHLYVVKPTGPFEDDPNVTNKRFPGNPTKSYRSRYPLRIVAEVEDWDSVDPEFLKQMLEGLEKFREQGLDVIED